MTIADAAHSDMAQRELRRAQAERELTAEQIEAEQAAEVAARRALAAGPVDRKPAKRGDYVVIAGVLHPVTGSRQAETAASLVPEGRTVRIEHWDGSSWNETGTVLHGTRV